MGCLPDRAGPRGEVQLMGVPGLSSMAKVTMLLLPAATPPAGTVTEMVVPVDVKLLVPMSLTFVMAP